MQYEIKYREPLYRNSKPIEYRENENGCWEVYSHAPNGNGYPKLTIRGKSFIMSRLVYCQENNLNIEEFDSNILIRHKCDNPLCINPSHLETGSTLDNINDKISRGRQPKGVSHGRTHLSKEDVINIFNDTRLQKEIAKEYRISQSRVSGIKRKETFKDILEDL